VATFLPAFLISTLAAPLGDSPAVELRYTGNLVQLTRDGGQELKAFKLYGLVRNGESAPRDLVFLVEENGDAWPWPERFGRIDAAPAGAAADRTRIQLLHRHDGTLYPLPLPDPLFAHADRLRRDAVWTAGQLEYEVVGEQQRGDRSCWQVDASTNFGRTHTLWIEQETNLLVEARQIVFMGRGDRFEIVMKLDAAAPIDAGTLAALERPVNTLLALQRDLKRPANTTRPDLSDEQLQIATAALERLGQTAEATPFNKLASVISRDVRDQLQRADDVEDLVQRFVGQPAPEFELHSLAGDAIAPDAYAGKTVLLHFWKYHDDPLSEPYGQVGYIEFLKTQCERRKLDVAIYGVAVDPRLGDPEARGAVVRQIRKLAEFMNLSYPIAADDGTLLQKFGDPRRVGAELPLWIVLTPDGKVAHYKAGYYDIKPDEGLRQLQEAIYQVIRQQRTN
jgi:peroxiredoxin